VIILGKGTDIVTYIPRVAGLKASKNCDKGSGSQIQITEGFCEFQVLWFGFCGNMLGAS